MTTIQIFCPENSNDRDTPFFTLWPKNNTQEWIVYEFEKPEKISTASVFWYDDGPWGGCRIPLSWKLQYKIGNTWQNVKTKSAPASVKDIENKIEFEPVTTRSIRIVFQLSEKESVGVYEFAVK